jgi:hypothetical protein
MQRRLLVLLLLLSAYAAAQLDSGFPSLGHRVRVHINFSNGDECDASTKVALMKSPSAEAGRGSADKSCTVEFFGVPPGNYYLNISGRGFASVDSSQISLTSPDTETLEITVTRPATKESLDNALASASITAKDMLVPKRAAKEFAKANEEMGRGDWKSAITTLESAIATYPQYAAAYNNLGVVYAHLGDRVRESDALQRALEIDNRLVPAYVNLARMNIATERFPQAQALLTKAAGLNPADGITLVLLAYADYMDHRFDDAIANCRKVHELQTSPHAGAHWVAAFAFEQKHLLAEAATEFRIFVKEEATGIRADAARKEIANIDDFLSETPGRKADAALARSN